jgi:hypothetical protein
MSNRTLKICLTAALVTGALAASASAEFTVVEHAKFQDGDALDIACDQTVTKSYKLPDGATDVRVVEPHAGDALKDGFGEDRLGTIESVDVGSDSIDVTITGGYTACSYPGEWRTNGILVRATYNRVLHPKVFVSEEPGGLDARQEPKQITATADAGWKGMRWKNWGENTAVAKGKFYGVRAVDPTGTDADLKTFTYPVEVTLSKPKQCGDGYYYSKLKTRWLRNPNPEIAKQAKVPGVAGCLNGG